MLEDTQPPSSERQQGKPLHDDEVNEVYTRSLVEAGCEEVIVGLTDVAEPELAEGNAFAFEVPVCHCKGGNGLENANEAIGLEHELPINETIHLRFARLSEKDISFGSFICQNGCGSAICEAASAS